MRQWRQDAAVVLGGGALLLAWDLCGGDIVVTRWFGGAGGFAWRDSWWTSLLLHQGGRLVAGLMLALLALNSLRPLLRGPTRGERLRALAVTLACLVLVPALKHASATSCPWDLAEFGGVASYVPHWRLGLIDGGPGHCFPSGHAVGAFAFLSVYFLLRRHRPLAARRCLAAVCLVGLPFGAGQVARGAHHVSHVLWSAWLCWVICAAFTQVDRAAPSRAMLAPTGGR